LPSVQVAPFVLGGVRANPGSRIADTGIVALIRSHADDRCPGDAAGRAATDLGAVTRVAVVAERVAGLVDLPVAVVVDAVAGLGRVLRDGQQRRQRSLRWR
jgi:hypothetical protein